jgi:ArsR family transcriptional regulator, arsenate/arsenite/antimonite-responsive transcriptional repressor
LDLEIYKALCDENRLRMINLLMYKELCVCEIEAVLGLSQSNASRHLNKLKTSGIVISKKHSQWSHYSIDPDFISHNSKLFEHLKEKFSEQELYANDIVQLEHMEINKTC